MAEPFHRPRSVPEAVSLKRRLKGRGVYLAGGTGLNSGASPARAECYVSLAALKLDRIVAAQGKVTIGAGCTLQQLLEDRKVPPPLRAAVGWVASRNIRNAATLGGHVACAQPHSDILPMLVALEAALTVAGPAGSRTVPLLDYLRAPAAGLIIKIVIPAARGRLAACGSFRASTNARSLVTAAVSLARGRSGIEDPIVAVGGVAPRVARLAPVEAALGGRPLPPPEEIAALVSRHVKPAADAFATAEFKRYQAGVLVARAFQDALARPAARRAGDRP